MRLDEGLELHPHHQPAYWHNVVAEARHAESWWNVVSVLAGGFGLGIVLGCVVAACTATNLDSLSIPAQVGIVVGAACWLTWDEARAQVEVDNGR